MTAQTANKATVPVGTDGWKLTDHIKQAIETTRSIIPVADEAERDALKDRFPGAVLPVPTYVNRANNSNVIEKWDGTKWIGRQHIEFTFDVPSNGTNTGIPDASLWGPGVLTLDTSAASTDQALASSPGPDMIQLNKGTYAVAFLMSTNRVSTGTSWVQIRKGDDSDVYAHGPGNEVWASTAVPNLRVTADNSQFRLRLKWTGGGWTSVKGRVRITRIG